jgi:hypothetical protein
VLLVPTAVVGLVGALHVTVPPGDRSPDGRGGRIDSWHTAARVRSEEEEMRRTASRSVRQARMSRERTRPRAPRANVAIPADRSRPPTDVPARAGTPGNEPNRHIVEHPGRRALALPVPRGHRARQADVDNSLRGATNGVYGPRPSVGSTGGGRAGTTSCRVRPSPRRSSDLPPAAWDRARSARVRCIIHTCGRCCGQPSWWEQRPVVWATHRAPPARSDPGPAAQGTRQEQVWHDLRRSTSRSSGTTASTW